MKFPSHRVLNFASGVLALLLVGCAQVWVKPGGTQDDFRQDRYACLQQAQQRSAGFSFNRFGGSASDGMATNDGLFSACMNARGWTLTRQDPTTTPPDPLADAGKVFKADMDANCARADMQPLWAKSPCDADAITLAQLADPSFASEQEKPLISKWRIDVSEHEARLLTSVRGHGGARGQAVAAVLEASSWRREQIALDLYSGKKTWGQFNVARKEEARKAKDELVVAVKGPLNKVSSSNPAVLPLQIPGHTRFAVDSRSPVPTSTSIGTAGGAAGAERLARDHSCSETPHASLFSRDSSLEVFTVSCSNGTLMAVQCGYGKCALAEQ